jgi:probable rRNA maturation factor
MSELIVRNRQRVRAVNVLLLKRLTRAVLASQPNLESYALGIHLVDSRTMAKLNPKFLGHEGSTDIITFDHSEAARGSRNTDTLHGELFICLDDAVKQARGFRSTWQAELARYVIHGILHLRGYDDTTPAARRTMKREENRLCREMARAFPIARLGRRRARGSAPGDRAAR